MLYTSTSIMWVKNTSKKQLLHGLTAQPDPVVFCPLMHPLQVDVVCTSRIPEFFLINLMTSGGSVLNKTRQHEPGEIADFTISLPQSVNACSLHVRIRAGNSAGMSAPSEAVQTSMLATIQLSPLPRNWPAHVGKLCLLTTQQDAPSDQRGLPKWLVLRKSWLQFLHLFVM